MDRPDPDHPGATDGWKPTTHIWPVVLMLVLAIGIAALAAWHALNSLADINALTDQRAAARSGRMQLIQTLSLLKDLETGMRGFALTGDAQFLKPYHDATKRLPKAYENTYALLADKLPPGFAWTEFDRLLQVREGTAARVIADRIQKGDAVHDDVVQFGEGKQAMDGIRAIIQQLDDTLVEYVDQKDRAVRAARLRAERVSFALLGTTLALILLSVLLTLRERRLRLQLEIELHRANQNLEARVTERTAALNGARERISNFAIEQDRAIEQERRRLAREVHDQIGQVFTAVKLILMSVRQDAFPAGQAAALDQAIESGITTARRITADLRPPLLDDLGLAAALEHYANSVVRPAQLACKVTIHDQAALTNAQALGLFRIVQEAMTNILRHADARQVTIAGEASSGSYRLRIADDGAGFDPAQVRLGAQGLAGMRERARLMQGRCTISAGPEGGTVVEIELPLHDRNENEHPAA